MQRIDALDHLDALFALDESGEDVEELDEDDVVAAVGDRMIEEEDEYAAMLLLQFTFCGDWNEYF